MLPTNSTWEKLSKLSLLSFEIVFIQTAFIGLGYLGDQKFHTAPALVITGLVVGMAGWIYHLLKRLRKLNKF